MLDLFSSQQRLFQIDAGYYCAGLIVEDVLIIDSAPILKWMIGKYITEIEQYCKYKKFKLIEI